MSVIKETLLAKSIYFNGDVLEVELLNGEKHLLKVGVFKKGTYDYFVTDEYNYQVVK